MSTKYDHMESGRGPFLIDLDAPVSALADGEASTNEGQIGRGSPTEFSCPAVDSVESELSSDASYTSFTTENQLTPASCVDDDGDSSWAAYGTYDSPLSISKIYRLLLMQETCAFQTEASNAGYLATPTYCDPVDEGSNLAADEASESDARYDGMSYLSSAPQYTYPSYTEMLAMSPPSSPPHQIFDVTPNRVVQEVYDQSERMPSGEAAPQIEKPPYSYNALLLLAIHHSKKIQLRFSEIQKSLVNMFPYFGGQFKSWSSFRRVLSYSNCFSNSDLKWSINYDKVFYSMFKKRSTTGSEKYKRYLHEQLNLTPVVPERKLRGEQLSLPYQSCCEPREVEDPLNSRKDCVQTQHLPSNGTFAESVTSNQNRQKKRCSAVVPISVERNGVVELTVTALQKTSHSFVAANTVTYDSTRLDPDRHGRSPHAGCGQCVGGDGAAYDMTYMHASSYQNNDCPPLIPIEGCPWGARSSTNLASHQMYWQQDMQHQYAKYHFPYISISGNAQSDVSRR